MLYFAAALLLINLTAFAMMGIDKRRAEKGLWRISEKSLLIACALFGAAGGLLGMKLFRHKTKKPKFSLGVPVLLIIQIALLVGLAGYMFG